MKISYKSKGANEGRFKTCFEKFQTELTPFRHLVQHLKFDMDEDDFFVNLNQCWALSGFHIEFHFNVLVYEYVSLNQ
jgi:two-component sensor histidine kinase